MTFGINGNGLVLSAAACATAAVLLLSGCATPATKGIPVPAAWQPQTRALTRDEVLGRVRWIARPEAQRLLEQAKVSVASNDYATAARLFTTCLDQYPDSQEITNFVGAGIIGGLVDTKHFDTALRLCDRAAAARPTDRSVWSTLALQKAVILFKQEDFAGASAMMEAAWLGSALDAPEQWRQCDAATTVYVYGVDGICRMNRNWPKGRAETHVCAVQSAELRAVAEAIKRGDAEEVEARLEHRRLSHRARVIMMTGDEQALAPGEKPLQPSPGLAGLAREALAACAPSPEKPRAYYWRGRLREFLAEYDQAADDFRMGIENAKDADLLGKLRYRLAGVLRYKGQTADARKLYEANFADPATRDPWGGDGLLVLGQDHWQAARAAGTNDGQRAALTEFSAAATMFARVMDEAPKHYLAAKAGLLAGQALLQSKDLAGAATRLRAVVDQYSTDREVAPEALYWLGDALIKQGDTMGAYRAWKELAWEYAGSKWAKYVGSRRSRPVAP